VMELMDDPEGVDTVMKLLEEGASVSRVGLEDGHPPLTGGRQLQAMQLMRELRKKLFLLSTAPQDRYAELLYQLYSIYTLYPFDPMLHEHEITRTMKQTPSGSGGFADCWEGIFLGKLKVAMKTPRSGLADQVSMRRLMREMKVWSRLHHPNILPFIGCCTLEGISYMISPWMENGDALDFVRKGPYSCSLELLLQVANGLQYLHEFDPPVIHGDLKSANIFISEQGKAHIADFGLSELMIEGADDENSSAWHNGGNPRWQAPEILKEGARRTKETDVFAFGRVMLEFLTGKAPFPGLSTPQAMIKVINNEHPERPRDYDAVARGLDDGMWGLMERCWDTEPSRRPVVADLVSSLHLPLEEPRQPATVAGRVGSKVLVRANRYSPY